ncbi:MAG: hypothetical protein ABI718_15725 [Acidobacteriota bacterium]
MLRERIAGVVVELPVAQPGNNELALIFDDDAFYDFYSSQEISDGIYIQLSGADAYYRYVRDVAVTYNA